MMFKLGLSSSNLPQVPQVRQAEPSAAVVDTGLEHRRAGSSLPSLLGSLLHCRCQDKSAVLFYTVALQLAQFSPRTVWWLRLWLELIFLYPAMVWGTDHLCRARCSWSLLQLCEALPSPMTLGNRAITHSPGLWSFFHWDNQKPRSLRSLKMSRLCGHRRDMLGCKGQTSRYPLKVQNPPRDREMVRVWCQGKRPLRHPGPSAGSLPAAYHRRYDGLLGHPPVGHQGSSRPEESKENRVGAGRDRALLEPTTAFLFPSSLLNLVLGRVKK